MIDWDRIAELQEEVGEEGFSEVIQLFFEEVEEVLLSVQADNADQLKSTLHFLKGAALNIGMSTMSELCRDAEQCAKKRGVECVDMDRIRKAFDSSKIELCEILD